MKKALTAESLKKGIMQASPLAQTDCMTTSRRFKCVPQNLGLLSIHIFDPLFLVITHSF